MGRLKHLRLLFTSEIWQLSLLPLQDLKREEENTKVQEVLVIMLIFEKYIDFLDSENIFHQRSVWNTKGGVDFVTQLERHWPPWSCIEQTRSLELQRYLWSSARWHRRCAPGDHRVRFFVFPLSCLTSCHHSAPLEKSDKPALMKSGPERTDIGP